MLDYCNTNGYIIDEAAGRQKFKCRPYQRDWCLAPTDPEVEGIACVKPARIGWSEIVKQNIHFYTVARPSKILLVQPTDSEVSAYSKEEIDPLFDRDTGVPAMAGLLTNKKTKSNSSNTYSFKKLKNGSLIHLVNAATPRSARRYARNVILFEEPDAYDSPEGDTIKNFMQRSATFWERFIMIGGTPISPNGYMDQAYRMGDQQVRYYPCPECNHYQRFVWENFILDGEHEGKYECQKCHHPIEYRFLRQMDENAGWACPLDRDRSSQVFNSKGVPIWRSFQVDAGMAYHPHAQWINIVRRYKIAKMQLAQGNPDPMQTHYNTDRGLPWEDVQASKITATNLHSRRNDKDKGNGYGPTIEKPDWKIPNGVLLITAGGDTQGGGGTMGQRLVITIWGWGRDDEGWHLGHFEIMGDPQSTEVLSQLDRIAETVWTREDGARLRLTRGLQDEGGDDTSTQALRDHLAGGTRVWLPCRGAPQLSVPLLGKSFPAEIKDKRKKTRQPLMGHWVGYQDSIKHLGYRLNVENAGPGYLHFGNNLVTPDQYLDELFPWRKKRTTKAGTLAYIWGDPPAGRRDEGGDCTRYAIAARLQVAQSYAPGTMWDQLEAQCLRTIPGLVRADSPLAGFTFA